MVQKSPVDGARDRGYGLLGLLAVVVVLGGVAAAVVVALPSDPSGLRTSSASSSDGRPASPPSGRISAAARQACVADFRMLSEAITEYQLQNGALPTSVAQLESLVHENPSTPGYSFVIDAGRPGRLQVRTPGHPAADGDANCLYAASSP